MEDRVTDDVLALLAFSGDWRREDFTKEWREWLLDVSIQDWWHIIAFLAQRREARPAVNGDFTDEMVKEIIKNWEEYGDQRHWFLAMMSDQSDLPIKVLKSITQMVSLTFFELAVNLIELEGPGALQVWLRLERVFPKGLSGAELAQLLRALDGMTSPLLYQDLNDTLRNRYAQTTKEAVKPSWMLPPGATPIDGDFSTRGPAHPSPGESVDSPGARMFESLQWEENSEDDAMATDWFIGYCTWDSLTISNRKRAFRIPRPEGGFEGCFCSVECSREVVVRRFDPPEEMRDKWITEEEKATFAFESSVIYRLLIDRIVEDLDKFGVLDEED
jgi:hypothetical protein